MRTAIYRLRTTRLQFKPDNHVMEEFVTGFDLEGYFHGFSISNGEPVALIEKPNGMIEIVETRDFMFRGGGTPEEQGIRYRAQKEILRPTANTNTENIKKEQ